MNRKVVYCILGAMLVGFLVRFPGVFWGANFPFGWWGHHPDEYTHAVNAELLIYPFLEARWRPHPYPKGLAVHAAVPMLLEKELKGTKYTELPHPKPIIVAGRVIGVLYGTATVLVVFLCARCLFRDARVALLAAWIMALGGLHVSQSHYFVADVPALFWFLLGLYLLAREIQSTEDNRTRSSWLLGAAFAFGVAFGLKLTVAGLPTLGLVALAYPPRLMRVIHTACYSLAGFVLVNFASYTPRDLLLTFERGVGDPTYQFSRISSLILYLIELPSAMSLPVVLLAAAGSALLLKKLFSGPARRQWHLYGLVVILPLVISGLLTLKVSHFPRHIVPFLPWLFMAAAWSLVRLIDRLQARGVSSAWILAPFFAYLALFVFDGERVFLQEPRNQAARWVQQNVSRGEEIYWERHAGMEEYRHVYYPDARPNWMVLEMYNANHYLSGLGFKNSYPKDYRFIFDAGSQDWVDAYQSVFKGSAGYEEVVRFGEGYFMPEYVVTDALIGNRSRNYVSEVVIFRKQDDRVAGS